MLVPSVLNLPQSDENIVTPTLLVMLFQIGMSVVIALLGYPKDPTPNFWIWKSLRLVCSIIPLNRGNLI